MDAPRFEAECAIRHGKDSANERHGKEKNEVFLFYSAVPSALSILSPLLAGTLPLPVVCGPFKASLVRLRIIIFSVKNLAASRKSVYFASMKR